MLHKVKEATENVAIGMKESSYRSEIRDRRKEIRNLKSLWGRFAFEHLENHDLKQLQGTHVDSQKKIYKLQEEIHEYEAKLIILKSYNDPPFLKKEHLKKAHLSAKTDPKDGSIVKEETTGPKEEKYYNCHKCGNAVVDKTIICGPAHYHLTCFKCVSCSTDLSSKHHCLSLNEDPYCESCGEKKLNEILMLLDPQEILNWCQNELREFNQVFIPNFAPSTWREGYIFPAFVAHYKPDFIDYKLLTENADPEKNFLKRCQHGLDGLKETGVLMLWHDADDLPECDSRSLFFQMVLLQRYSDKLRPNQRSVEEWNRYIGYADDHRNFEKEKNMIHPTPAPPPPTTTTTSSAEKSSPIINSSTTVDKNVPNQQLSQQKNEHIHQEPVGDKIPEEDELNNSGEFIRQQDV